MSSLHALLVGIDDYPPETAGPLKGCVNDTHAARAWLQAHAGASEGPAPRIRFLHNACATRAAIADGIRTHLGRAGAGDTALLWFSGHGTHLPVETGQQALIEATGRCQALVAADGPLLDKDLGALLDGAAARGARVVAVLDCCYSGGATREPGLTARYTPRLPGWRGAGQAAGAGNGAPPRHVLLAASRLNERSFEAATGAGGGDGDAESGPVQGVFSDALLAVARAAPPGASVRELLAAAHARVRRTGVPQRPVLWPDTPGGPADAPLLGGAVRGGEVAPHLLRFGPDGWEVNCGAAHGLRAGDALAPRVEFTVTDFAASTASTASTAGTASVASGVGGGAPGSVRARRVEVGRTLIDPAGWTPADTRRAYPVALSALPLPPAAVAVDAPGQPDAAGWLRAAVGESPLLRLDSAPGTVTLRVEVTGGRARVLPGHDLPPVPEALAVRDAYDAGRVAACLSHLARWHQLRELDCPASPLSGLVRVEIVPWGGDSPRLPDGGGEFVFAYAGAPGDWRPPWVSIRLRNLSPRRTLWCLLLDLTDSYAAHTLLYPGHFIAPGGTGHALDGEPVQLSLPAARRPEPGALVRDWLKLIVAESELDPVAFRLEALRPGHAVAPRDILPVPRATRPESQWAVTTFSLRTIVPRPGRWPGQAEAVTGGWRG